MASEDDPAFQQMLEVSLKASAIQARQNAEGRKAYLDKRKWSQDIDELSRETSHRPSSSSQETTPASLPRQTIEDCIQAISESHLQDMPRPHDPEGDTYVFIDPPSRQPEQTDWAYAQYQRRYSQPFVMRCEKLKEASHVFKEKLDSSTYQFRVLRRHGHASKLPPHIKYVLDLTPPNEGDDAVYLTASLSCSEGVRFWHEAGNIWKVSERLVGGKEDRLSQAGSVTPDVACLEYSPLRHRAAIERVLAAIHSNELVLDSAVKLWTTAVVAQFFGITYDRCTLLTDSMITWLRVEPNNHFLEVNPEVSVRVAAGLENYDLTRDCFAILVGEEALDLLRRNRIRNPDRRLTALGRKRDDLPETLIERVEYASKAFVERNIKDFESLVFGDMQWLEDLPSIRRLDKLGEPDLQPLINSLKTLLKGYQRGVVYCHLCARAKITSPPSKLLSERLLPRYSRELVWDESRPTERIFTRKFWSLLQEDEFHYDKKEYVMPREMLAGYIQHDPLTRNLVETDLLRDWRSQIDELVEEASFLLNKLRPEITNSDENLFDRVDELLATERTPPTQLSFRQLKDLNPGTASEATSTAPPQQDQDKATTNIAVQQRGHVGGYPPMEFPDAPPPYEPLPLSSRAAGLCNPRTPGMIDPLAPLPDYASINDDAASTSYPLPRNSSRPTSHLSRSSLEALRPTIASPEGGTQQTQATANTNTGGYLEERKGALDDYYFHLKSRGGGLRETESANTLPVYDSLRSSSAGTPVPSTPSSAELRGKSSRFFNQGQFFDEAKEYLAGFAAKKLLPSDAAMRQDPFRTSLIGTLTSLEESEWKYLPLWAGGLDDGTGAVYNDDIMETAPGAGFSTAGPSIHTGSSTYSDRGDFDMLSDAGTSNLSFNASTAVMDGHTDQLHRHRVYSAGSNSSNEDSVVDVAGDEEEEWARRQIAIHEKREEDAAAARSHERSRSLDEDEDVLYEEDLDDAEDFDDDVTEKGEDDFEDVMEGLELGGESEDGVLV